MLGDISKTIGKEFLVAAFLPSSVLVGMNVLFVRWHLLPHEWVADWDVFGAAKLAAILAVIFASAIVLTVGSSLVYRLFEGYHTKTLLYVGGAVMGSAAVWSGTDASRRIPIALFGIGFASLLLGVGQGIAHWWHRKRATRWLAFLGTIEDSKKAIERYRFVRRYPQDPKLVRATAFGNILRAFEEYPSVLWGIDPITTWVRLASILPDAFAAQIGDAKITVSLLLNLSVVAMSLALETVLVAQPTVGDKWSWAIITWLTIAAGSYVASLSAAGRWGEYVRSAFDLYRLDLLAKMKIELPKGPFSFADEREIWAGVQLATFYAEDPGDSCHVVVTAKAPARDPWSTED